MLLLAESGHSKTGNSDLKHRHVTEEFIFFSLSFLSECSLYNLIILWQN